MALKKKRLAAVILAAGRGTRMKSDIPKVMHLIFGKPMIRYVTDLVRGAGVHKTVVVTGYKGHLVKEALPAGTVTVTQRSLSGSGDAVAAARQALGNFTGDLLVLCGDTPLLGKEAVDALIRKHRASGASATLLAADLKNPTGYGRIVRDAEGCIEKIVEETEASLFEKVITEINVGAYCFDAREAFRALEDLRPDNRKKEYYITDVIRLLKRKAGVIESVAAEDPESVIGINSRHDLAEAVRILKTRKIEDLMARGVTVVDPASTVIDPDAAIGADTVIYSHTVIEGAVTIGRRCHVGPFARLRGGVVLDDAVEVGNFVELVRTRIASGTKVKHHAYLGDAVVGRNVNIGAGTITANYDGKDKNVTVIEDGAFLGVGSILVAPVTVGRGATVGAGSVVLKKRNVPRNATVAGVPARILRRSRA